MLDIMWHEARKQERKIRGMLVDYKRRAERRREYYEKIVSINGWMKFFQIFYAKLLRIWNILILCFNLGFIRLNNTVNNSSTNYAKI